MYTPLISCIRKRKLIVSTLLFSVTTCVALDAVSEEFPMVEVLEATCGLLNNEISKECYDLLVEFEASIEAPSNWGLPFIPPSEFANLTMQEVFVSAAKDRRLVLEALDRRECHELVTGPIRRYLRERCHVGAMVRHFNFLHSCPIPILEERPPNYESLAAEQAERLEYLAREDVETLEDKDDYTKYIKYRFYREGLYRLRCAPRSDTLTDSLPPRRLGMAEMKARWGYSDADIEQALRDGNERFWPMAEKIRRSNVTYLAKILARLGVQEFMTWISGEDYDQPFLDSWKEQFPLTYYTQMCQAPWFEDDELEGPDPFIVDCLYGQYLAHTLDGTDERHVRHFAMITSICGLEDRERAMPVLMAKGVPKRFFTETLLEDDRRYFEEASLVAEWQGPIIIED